MQTRRVLTLFLAFVLVLTGLSVHRATAADQNTIVIANAENAQSLDPARGYEQESGIISKATYDTLVTFPAEGVDKILPNLATSWKISDDGITYTFTLKDGVAFSTGNTMSSADVVFSFNRMINIKGNPSSLASGIDSVSAPDAKTVVIKLKAPDPSLLAILEFPAFSVTDSKTVKEHGGTDAADADKTDKAEQWLNQNSVGTGPYILTKWEQHNQIVLAKNPKYGGTPAAVDQIIFRDIKEAASQKAALEAGDVDVAMDLTPDQSASIKKNPDLKLYEGPSPLVFFVLMNQDKKIGGPVSDGKVQKAVRLALDYQGILKLAGGAAVQPPSVIPVGFAGTLGQEKVLKRDVDAAKKLLADAGQGSGFSVDMEYWDTTYQGINFGVMAQKIQADLKEVGITVNLKPGTIDVTLANYRDGKEQVGMWFWGPDFQDALNYVEFLPNFKVGKRVNWTNDNSDKDIQGLRDQVKAETDAAKRADLFGKIQLYLQDKGPWAPFLQPGVQIGYRANVKGVRYHFQWTLDPAQLSK